MIFSRRTNADTRERTQKTFDCASLPQELKPFIATSAEYFGLKNGCP